LLVGCHHRCRAGRARRQTSWPPSGGQSSSRRRRAARANADAHRVGGEKPRAIHTARACSSPVRQARPARRADRIARRPRRDRADLGAQRLAGQGPAHQHAHRRGYRGQHHDRQRRPDRRTADLSRNLRTGGTIDRHVRDRYDRCLQFARNKPADHEPLTQSGVSTTGPTTSGAINAAAAAQPRTRLSRANAQGELARDRHRDRRRLAAIQTVQT